MSSSENTAQAQAAYAALGAGDMAASMRNPADGIKGDQVLVVGGSISGLLTARALAGTAASVVVLERDHWPQDVSPRGRVPQGRHLHVLLAAGLDLLADWFPGIEDELESFGAVRVDGTRGWIYQGGAYRARGDLGRPLLSCTRPLLEHVVRRRLTALPNVRLEDRVVVQRVTRCGPRVTGAVVDGQHRPADLVVDCSGRSSRIAHDLAASGVLSPPVTHVGIDLAYTSFFLRRRAEDFEGDFVMDVESPRRFRAAVVFPVEGERWQVTLAGVHGDVPPTTDEGIAAFTATLGSPAVAQLVARCERVSQTQTYRFPSSQWRHYEKLPHLLEGLVMLGDAACSFDPVYGQGMTSAALQAALLGRLAAQLGIRSPDLPKRFHRVAAGIIEAPWRIAVGGDFGHPATSGPMPLGTPLLNAYIGRVIQAAHSSLPVARSLNRVLQLQDPPAALLTPGTFARVLHASRHSPALTGAAIPHPRVGQPIALSRTTGAVPPRLDAKREGSRTER